MNKIQELTVNTIRMLSVEGVQSANSGHPGLPLGAAPIAYNLYANDMVYNSQNPGWHNRDRFVLSAGHGSMLLYSVFHLFGFGLEAADLMRFRQEGSKTPGHPEYKHTAGVETTTGPLGQGIANAVGMAQAESVLAAKFNRDGFNIVDHYTYCLTGDGCMMEGIEYEAASLAGTWGLGKLIVFYDKNNISIEGNIDIAFREDVGKRHEAQGWHVQHVYDMHDLEAMSAAVVMAKSIKDKPSIIIVHSIIGYGSPLQGNADSHGAPLGKNNIEVLRKNLNWTYAPFEVPKEVKAHMQDIIDKGTAAEEAWKKLVKGYKKQYPELYEEYMQWQSGKIADLAAIDGLWQYPDKPEATRNTSGAVLAKISAFVPNLIGGSADLAPSNKTYVKGRGDYSFETPTGMNMHFGIREHAMAAIANGMYVHGGLYPYCATFFVFSDYMKNAIRMSAIMGLPVTYVLTHDSIGVGEDGPTHQPVEHLASLRSIPDMKVFRPADGKETTAAWISALSGNQPTAIVLSRQNMRQYKNSGKDAFKGGYILSDSQKPVPDLLIMASGSEVELAVDAQAELLSQGIDARVISMPCMELYDQQPLKYRESVMPAKVRARVAIEAGRSMCWYKYTGLDGAVIGMDQFGASAPADKLFVRYGFTVTNVVETALRVKKNTK